MGLKEDIQAFQPFNEQEEKDKALILSLLETQDLWTRDNRTAHLTASGWVVSKDHRKILMAYHNLYDSWAWLGGHADGNHDLLSVAIREVKEESGLADVQPADREIFSLEVLTVDGHEKKGEYVSSHLHINVTYLLEADDTLPVHNKPDENRAVAWFGLEEVYRKSTEPWFIERIYRKLNQKLIRKYKAEEH